MTGYTVHTGTSKKFASGWDDIFGDKPAKSGKKSTKQNEAKQPAKAKQKTATSGKPSGQKKGGKKQVSRKQKK